MAYFRLLDWLNVHGFPRDFRTLRVLNRGTHGWVEYVEHGPCPDLAAVGRYYERSGMLLGLLYVLEATDCHRENVIACGEHPVLIDTETLLCPRVREDTGHEVDASLIANQQFTYSVLRTCFLPRWEMGLQGDVLDVSGLGDAGAEGKQTVCWVKALGERQHGRDDPRTGPDLNPTQDQRPPR